MVSTQKLEPVAPDGPLPIDFEVAQPIRRFHERWALAELGVCDSRPVMRFAKLRTLQLRSGWRCRGRLQGANVSRQPVALPAHGLHLDSGRIPERTPNQRDVVLEVVLLHYDIGPQLIHQVLLLLQRTRSFHEELE